jgi:hypothetical protein
MNSNTGGRSLGPDIPRRLDRRSLVRIFAGFRACSTAAICGSKSEEVISIDSPSKVKRDVGKEDPSPPPKRMAGSRAKTSKESDKAIKRPGVIRRSKPLGGLGSRGSKDWINLASLLWD